MLRRLALLLGLAIALCGGPVRADGDSTDEVLKRFFPERDLSKAALKIVNLAARYYAVADTAEILADGRVRVTNVVVIQVINGQPNQPMRFSSIEYARAVLKFKRPVKQLADLADNPFVSAE